MKTITQTTSYGKRRIKVDTHFDEKVLPSKTDASQANECDPNYIMKKFRKTGTITHLAKGIGSYQDVSNIPDLHLAMTQVSQAQQAFDALPSELRRRFGNSPVEMIHFLQDPNNDQEAIKLGLKVAKPIIPTEAQATNNSTKRSSSPQTKKTAKNDDESNDDE